jgi:hypothetical protein
MNVPCPVLSRSPWSPVGYQVVEVADEQLPGAQPRPQPAVPASPLGYCLLSLSDEAFPPPAPKVRRRRVPQQSQRLFPWALAVAGGLFLVALMVALLALSLPARPTIRSSEVAWSAPPAQPGMPAGPAQVALPKFEDAEPAAEPPGEAAPPARAEACAADAANPAWGFALPVRRETFGTAVGFARNPAEAARLAAAEGKLTFLLHVSGNFEEARFT